MLLKIWASSYIVSPQPLPIANGCLLYNTLVRHHHEYIVLALWICDTDCLERIRLLLVRLGLHPLNHVPWMHELFSLLGVTLQDQAPHFNYYLAFWQFIQTKAAYTTWGASRNLQVWWWLMRVHTHGHQHVRQLTWWETDHSRSLRMNGWQEESFAEKIKTWLGLYVTLFYRSHCEWQNCCTTASCPPVYKTCTHNVVLLDGLY